MGNIFQAWSPNGQNNAQGNISYSDFMNPAGNQAGNYNAAMGNMLGATTGAAPTMTPTQLGAAQSYGGATIGPTALSGNVGLGPTATYGGAQMDSGQYNQTFGQEQGLANRLGLQAQGQGPSVAQTVAQQQAGQNLQNQMAMLGSQRGSSNPALAQMSASQAGANAQQQAAQQAVLGRTQEELGAQASQGNLLGSMNNQATNFAGNQAQLAQQAGLANAATINSQNLAGAQIGLQNQQFNANTLNAQQLAQAQLMQQAGLSNQSAYNQFQLQQGQMGEQAGLANLQSMQGQNQLNAQQYNQYLASLQAQNAQQQQGQMAYEQLASGQYMGLQGLESQAYQANAGNTMKLVGGAASAMGSAAMMSDRRAKTNIKDGSSSIEDLLNFLAGW